MSKKKLITTAFMLLLLLAILGCGKTTEVQRPQEFQYGTEGVVMSFMSNSPAPIIYGGDQVSVIVELKNKGTHPRMGETSPNIFEGRVHLSGFDPVYLPLSPIYLDIEQDFFGRSRYDSIGGYSTASFIGTANLQNLPEAYSPIIQATLCYKYQTVATTQVCIDPNPYSFIKNKVCEISNFAAGSGYYSLDGGQGAPVAVTKIEEQITPTSAKFLIYFDNVGSGIVIKPASYYNCPFALNVNDVDYVEAKVWVSTNEITYSCKPSFLEIRLQEGGGFLVCDYPLLSRTEPAFLTPITVQLDYVYSESIQTQVEIIRT